MKRIWEIYPALTRAVKASHKALPWPMLYCHDFDHVVRVGDRALVIAESEHFGRLAGAAGLCHNADRMLQKQRDLGRSGHVPDEDVLAMVAAWLDAEPEGTFTREERAMINDAVLHHPKRNAADDGPVLQNLQDADRTVNIELDVMVRKGQYFGDELAVVDSVNLVGDPSANYRDPKSILWTILDDIECFSAEGGVASLRLPKARKLAVPLFIEARRYLNAVLEQRMRAGLIPFPTFD